jgi:hypothetical protein
MWTAFGIMMGYVADLAFYFVPDHGIELGLNWRLMMGSAMIPAVIVCCLIHLCPESPRWYLSKNEHEKAFKAVCELRWEKVQAARDVFYMQTLLKAETEAMSIGKQSRIKEFLTIRRNRNAMVASEIVMFMQQMCGINVRKEVDSRWTIFVLLTLPRSLPITPPRSSWTLASPKLAHWPLPLDSVLSTGSLPCLLSTRSTHSGDETSC